MTEAQLAIVPQTTQAIATLRLAIMVHYYKASFLSLRACWGSFRFTPDVAGDADDNWAKTGDSQLDTTSFSDAAMDIAHVVKILSKGQERHRSWVKIFFDAFFFKYFIARECNLETPHIISKAYRNIKCSNSTMNSDSGQTQTKKS